MMLSDFPFVVRNVVFGHIGALDGHPRIAFAGPAKIPFKIKTPPTTINKYACTFQENIYMCRCCPDYQAVCGPCDLRYRNTHVSNIVIPDVPIISVYPP